MPGTGTGTFLDMAFFLAFRDVPSSYVFTLFFQGTYVHKKTDKEMASRLSVDYSLKIINLSRSGHILMTMLHLNCFSKTAIMD